MVRKPYTLRASESPTSVHLTYTLPLSENNVYEGAPQHGQLLVSDSVNLHLNRFVKSDVLATKSPYNQIIESRIFASYFYAPEYGISSALINHGTITADIVQQHNLFETGTWQFMALPFDAKRADVQLGEGTYAAIRRFVPTEQAAGNYNAVWEELAMNDTIHAGEGYIYQFYKIENGVVDRWVYGREMADVCFTALPTANKQNMFNSQQQSIGLKHYPAHYVWNKNWNLIANPYECFYNIHNCGAHGIITVYNGRAAEYSEGTQSSYSYYSLDDDYYVLQPGEAFFYQAADNEMALTFPVAGQQLTAMPDSTMFDDESAIVPMAPGRGSRDIYNILLSDGTVEDRARVVINASASMDYEVGRDVLKLTPLTFNSPLFYVENDEVQMAINERPMADGLVYLSAQLPTAGTFSIRLGEQNGGTVTLLDLENGVVTDLSNSVYTFTGSAGTYTRRFVVGLAGGATDLQHAVGGEENVVKVIENNRVFIIRGGEKYDVLGNKQ